MTESTDHMKGICHGIFLTELSSTTKGISQISRKAGLGSNLAHPTTSQNRLVRAAMFVLCEGMSGEKNHNCFETFPNFKKRRTSISYLQEKSCPKQTTNGKWGFGSITSAFNGSKNEVIPRHLQSDF